MIYVKAGRPAGFNFRAESARDATLRAEHYAEVLGVMLLTVRAA